MGLEGVSQSLDILLSEMLQSSLSEHKMDSGELFEVTQWDGTVAVLLGRFFS